MRRRCVIPVSLLLLLAAASCNGQAGQKEREDVHEMEIIPKVKEPLTDQVDTIGFPEEAHGTPITGYQGYPEDELVKESEDMDEIAGFAGGGDIDYHNSGSNNAYGY